MAGVDGENITSCQYAYDQGQCRVGWDVRQRTGPARETGNYRSGAEQPAGGRFGNQGSDGRRHHDARFKLFGAIQNLRGEDRPSQRRSERGRDSRSHPGGHQNSAIHGRQAQSLRGPDSDRRSGLNQRSFAAARAAGPDRDGRCDRADNGRSRWNSRRRIVVRLHYRVGPGAGGLGRHAND